MNHLARAVKLFPLLLEAIKGGMSDEEVKARLTADRQRMDDAFAAAEARIRKPR